MGRGGGLKRGGMWTELRRVCVIPKGGGNSYWGTPHGVVGGVGLMGGGWGGAGWRGGGCGVRERGGGGNGGTGVFGGWSIIAQS